MADVKPATKWVEGKWSGLPKYDCSRCQFDTLELDRMVAHAEQHDAAEAPRLRMSELVDATGHHFIVEEKPAATGTEE